MVLDTGPLVSYLDRREGTHSWVREAFSCLRPPFFTCEAVLTEACFLLRPFPRAIDQIGSWVREGRIQVVYHLQADAQRVFALMEKYRDLPMSLADACLVAMVEQGMGDRILTLDEHFRIYRHRGRRVIPVLMPERAG